MEMNDREIKNLYRWMGKTTQCLRNIEKTQAEMKTDLKELGIFKGERKYIYGLITVLFIVLLGGFFI